MRISELSDQVSCIMKVYYDYSKRVFRLRRRALGAFRLEVGDAPGARRGGGRLRGGEGGEGGA